MAAANAFVAKNRFRHEKTIIPTRDSGEPVQVIETLDRQAQYKYLFQVAKGCNSETAVLFRNNDSALPLIDLLDQSNIPYRYRAFDGSFFTNTVISDLTDIINFAYDPNDGEAFMRIITNLAVPYLRKQRLMPAKRVNSPGKRS